MMYEYLLMYFDLVVLQLRLGMGFPTAVKLVRGNEAFPHNEVISYIPICSILPRG